VFVCGHQKTTKRVLDTDFVIKNCTQLVSVKGAYDDTDKDSVCLCVDEMCAGSL
jgi:hypothetical protein